MPSSARTSKTKAAIKTAAEERSMPPTFSTPTLAASTRPAPSPAPGGSLRARTGRSPSRRRRAGRRLSARSARHVRPLLGRYPAQTRSVKNVASPMLASGTKGATGER
jgi:hypothetical protein